MPEIGVYKGHKISYNTRTRKFEATVNELDLSAPTQDELQNLIDKTLKKSGVFPIPVIEVDTAKIVYGMLTSYDPDKNRGWFVSDKGERQCPWSLHGFYLVTENNKSIALSIQGKQAQMKELERQIQEEIKNLESPAKAHVIELFK